MKSSPGDAHFASCEILCPTGFSPELSISPRGSEVLMLLSGKMQLFLENRAVEMRYGTPVVVSQPYRVVCPQGPGTGRALRVAVAAKTPVGGKKSAFTGAKTRSSRKGPLA